MAKKKKTSNKLFLTIAAVCAIIIALVAIWKSFVFIEKFLFSGNDHFIVRNIIPENSNQWKGESAKLSQLLEIEVNKTNIFEVDLKKGRESLQLLADVASVSISRELPDTLRVDIQDRIPRATVVYSVFTSKGRTKDWLPLDINGVVMSKLSADGRENGLTKIIGCKVKDKIVEGMELDIVKPALEVVKQILTSKPFYIGSRICRFKVDTISLEQDGVIKFIVKLRTVNLKQPFVVTIKNDNNIPKSISEMRGYVLDLLSKKAPERRIDLTFDGVVPIRKL